MKRKKSSVWRLSVLGVIVCCFSLAFMVRADESKTLRVGLYQEEGYHDVSKDGMHSGYDYEYLMEIAKYTGWEYEFVEGTWEECVSMLENGEIDLLGGMRKQEERMDKMCFATMPSEYMTACLLVSPETEDYSYEDFAAFDGMRIGTLEGSTLDEFLKKYSEDNHFSYTLTRYSTEAELDRALKSKEIDSIYLSDNRNLDSYRVIASVGWNVFYYTLSRDKESLQDELNEALMQIHTRDPYYENTLYQKYFKAPQELAYTKEERAYIQQKRRVEVALIDEIPLICEYNESKKQYEGIIIDILEKLSEKTGLAFDYRKMPENVDACDYLDENRDKIVAPFYKNNMIDYDERLKILDTIVQSRMMSVSRAGEHLNVKESFVLAIPEDMHSVEEKIQKLFPKARLTSCKSHREGLDMVRNKKADMTLVNEISGSYMMQSPYYHKLIAANLENVPEDLTLSVSANADPLLIDIMNKGIASFDERDIREMVLDNTVGAVYDVSLPEWLYEKGLLLLFCIASAGGLFFVAVRRRRREEEMRIEEERRKADEEYRQKMFRQANFDTLTGVYNRIYFVRRAAELVETNPNTIYSFFRINIEKFKLINEIYGLEYGDMVLRATADKLRKDIAGEGVFGRDYSDHFLICYPVKEETLKNRRGLPAVYLECREQHIRVQYDVGAYVNTQKSTDVSRLLDYTQIALQEKDRSDSNTRIHFYEDRYMEHMLKNQKITNEMEHALEDGQFRVYLQPQFNHITNELVGAEALIRWIHPEEGMIGPSQFIPVFEGNHFICRLDEFVCMEVCRLPAEWRKKGKMVPVSINVSRANLQDFGFLTMLQSAVEKYEVPIQYLHLEITESAYVEDKNNLLEKIVKMKDLGFTVEMDDFGSGYSSFNALKDMPADIIKLDMKFFDGETHMDKGGTIIESIVKMAHAMGMMVIAEGVENEREANFLQSVQCHIVQGYLYGRPVPIEEFEMMLADSKVGEKRVGSFGGNREENRYWNLEKYNVLLRSNKAILFDYDPVCDYGVFTYMGEESGIVEKTVEHYVATILQRKRIHEDCREAIRKIMLEEEKAEEIEFLADYYEEGRFDECRALIYTYHKNGKLSRLFAVIKKKEGFGT